MAILEGVSGIIADEKFKQYQKICYDHHHRVQDLPKIPGKMYVWVTTGGHPVAGITITSADTPRSYFIKTPTPGEVRRN